MRSLAYACERWTSTYLLLLRFVLFVPITLAGLVLLVVRYGGWGRLRAAGESA